MFSGRCQSGRLQFFRERGHSIGPGLGAVRLIGFFYQLNEIFDLLLHDAVRRIPSLQNRRVGEWLK
jgi:hypothetical protein